jgi:phage repressor protein C with HTH and peptisase S24 domain
MQQAILHPCNKPPLSIAANLLVMEGLAEDHKLIRALVDWSGLPPSRVAAEIGAAATTITRPHKGKSETRLSRQTLARLRERFPDFPGWPASNGQVRSEVAGFGDRPFDEKFGADPLKAVPVYGTAMGGNDFDLEHEIELTEVDLGDVLDHVARPSSLAREGEAYALTVVGDSMWPRFRPGRRVIVSPRAPIEIGDDVVVQLRGSTMQTAPTNPDRVSMVLIKELVRRSASYIELRQFNPDVTFKIEVERVARIHKVVGEVF